MITEDMVKKVLAERVIHRWTFRHCSLCETPLPYLFAEGGRIAYDSSCDCGSYRSAPAMVSMEEFLTVFNRQSPEARDRLWASFSAAGDPRPALLPPFLPMEDAPQDASHVILYFKPRGFSPKGEFMVAHFAEGGGEEQPPFGPGWFYPVLSKEGKVVMYAEVAPKPDGWLPLPLGARGSEPSAAVLNRIIKALKDHIPRIGDATEEDFRDGARAAWEAMQS